MWRTLSFVALLACQGGVTPVDADDPVDDAPIRSCRSVIAGDLPEGVSEGAVAGTFSDWQPVPLQPDRDGDLVADLGTLVPGTYAWKYVWDGTFEGQPPPDVPTAWDGGLENRALVVEDCRVPELRPLDVQATADGRVQAEIQWVRGRDGASLDPDSLQVSVGEQPVEVEVGRDGRIRVDVSGLPLGKHSVRVVASDVDGRAAEAVWLPVWVEAEPFAWSDGVLYFAFVDRFRDGGPSPEEPIVGHLDGAGYRGGDLVGLRDALRAGYFDDLGVRSIWLSPIPDNPDGHWPGRNPGPGYTGYHGYWPTAPRTVEGRFGTTEVPADRALEQVIEEAHARGIRVVLDIVLNHVHEQHPWVDEHPEWFDLQAPCTCGDPGCGWEEMARTCRFAPYLPDVEYRAVGAVEAQLDELRWWLHTYDIDGLRLDAAKHMDHVILRRLSLDLQERVDAVGAAHVYLVGETFVGAGQQDVIRAYVADYELDGQFDFPLYWRIREAVYDGGSFRPLAAEARASDAAYGSFVHMTSPFFGNHDVARLSTELAGCSDWNALWGVCRDLLAEGDPTTITPEQRDLMDRLTVAWGAVVVRPGVPLLYYGDEIGLAGAGDPDNRRDMPWEFTAAQDALRERIAELARQRASSEALRRGEVRELWVDDSLYVVGRSTDTQVALAWLQRPGSDRTVSVPIPAEFAAEGTVFQALDDGPDVSVQGGRVELQIAGDTWDVRLLTADR